MQDTIILVMESTIESNYTIFSVIRKRGGWVGGIEALNVERSNGKRKGRTNWTDSK